MTITEIKTKIEKIENTIFIMSMADFMNWPRYYELCAEKEELKRLLKAGN